MSGMTTHPLRRPRGLACLVGGASLITLISSAATGAGAGATEVDTGSFDDLTASIVEGRPGTRSAIAGELQAASELQAATACATSTAANTNNSGGRLVRFASADLAADCATQSLSFGFSAPTSFSAEDVDYVVVGMDTDSNDATGCEGYDAGLFMLGGLDEPVLYAELYRMPTCDIDDGVLVADAFVDHNGGTSLRVDLGRWSSIGARAGGTIEWFAEMEDLDSYDVSSVPNGGADARLVIPGGTTPSTPPPTVTPPPAGATGYVIVAQSGTTNAFGAASVLASSGGDANSAPVVDVAYHPGRAGYWTLDQRGNVMSFGNARVLAGASTNVTAPGWRGGEIAVALSPTSTGNGYWVFTSAGRVLRFGDAGALPDLLSVPLQKPVVDAAPAVGTGGVYLVAEDGGVFALDAPFHGSVPAALNGRLPNRPVRAILPQAGGYMMVAEDGGVFSFGATKFQGSLPGVSVVPIRPIAAMVTSGSGYLLVGEDGGVFAFGTSFAGSLGGSSSSIERYVSIASL
jgi:hypothetical protein